MLERLAESPELNVSLDQLMGWRAVDEYGESALYAAIESSLQASPSDAELIRLVRKLISARPDLAEAIKRELLLD